MSSEKDKIIDAIIRNSKRQAFPIMRGFVSKEFQSYKAIGCNPCQRRFYELIVQDYADSIGMLPVEYQNWRNRLMEFVEYACINLRIAEEEANENNKQYKIEL